MALGVDQAQQSCSLHVSEPRVLLLILNSGHQKPYDDTADSLHFTVSPYLEIDAHRFLVWYDTSSAWSIPVQNQVKTHCNK